MSQIYFTSSYLPEGRTLSLEELSNYVDLRKIVLVLDTNLVVDYRDFFLSSQKFIENRHDTYMSLRYLVEQLDRCEIETNFLLGLDESTRRLSDFSRIAEKFDQASKILSSMLNSGIDQLDEFIKLNGEIAPVIDTSKKTISKVKALGQDFIGEQLLTVGYLLSLKLVDLKLTQEHGVISRAEAFKQFLNFAIHEVDVIISAIVNYALHIFGGVDSLRGILFLKGMKSSSRENVIHQIFNGSIDLIFPTLVNVIPKICYPNKGQLIPVFATRDEKLAEIHSLSYAKLIVDNGDSGFNFNIIESRFTKKQKLCWTKSDLTEFKKILRNDLSNRADKLRPGHSQSAEHLIPLVIELEEKILGLL